MPGVLLACCGMIAMAGRAEAQGFFLPSNDAQLRSDVALLADEGLLKLPTSAWPIPAADVREQLVKLDPTRIHESAQRAALSRLSQRLLVPPDEAAQWRIREARITAGQPGLLRDYGSLGRETLEVSSEGGASTDRWSVTLAATVAAAPDDGHHLRLDGTELSVRLGNWLLSVNQLERWWGPGWDGSLILSTNARPMPAISLDRQRSDPFDLPLLRWLGPWRFSAFLAAMEENRADVRQPLFLGMRASFKPLQILEVGLSRSAQFCGRDRPCNAQTFWNVILGNDNAGLRVSPEDEPGNQMAGFDLRVVSPLRTLPMAFSAQFIGEDNSSSGIPERYLGEFRLEGWWSMESGTLLRAGLEYANTNCKFSSPTADFPNFQNCAYRQGIFTSGYRYQGRNIGHSTDADAESVGVSAQLTRAAGDVWGVRLRRALLDRYGGIDPKNALTQGPSTYASVELSWSGMWKAQRLGLQLGYERREPMTGASDSGVFGFVQWRPTL